jgi:hypothetical protein
MQQFWFKVSISIVVMPTHKRLLETVVAASNTASIKIQ